MTSTNERICTSDVITDDNTTFYHMGLSRNILEGLTDCGFEKPSPVQLKAIPLGRCGFDLIIQAKSGTGKTAVFGIVALDMLNISHLCLQVLILAPTREIALQITQVISSIGGKIKGLKVGFLVGGIPLQFGKTMKHEIFHILVCTPGRLKHVINKNIIQINNVRLFVLDEADKLMDPNFRDDINEIFSKLPTNKQVISTSATYPPHLQLYLLAYMRLPHYCSPYNDNPILIGIRQFVATVPSHPNKMKQIQLKTSELIKILTKIPYKQCLVFLNYQSRVQSVCNFINKKGLSSRYITGNQDMSERLDAIEKLKNFEIKILFSTDLTARGIDADNVNLIINFDIPAGGATYLHRIGRAGRYGTFGLAINLVSEDELNVFTSMIKPINNSNLLVFKLPDYSKDIWLTDVKEFELFLVAEENDNNVTNNEVRILDSHKTQCLKQTNDIDIIQRQLNNYFSSENGTGDSKNNTTKSIHSPCGNIQESMAVNDKISSENKLMKKHTLICDFINNLYCVNVDILEKNSNNKKSVSNSVDDVNSCTIELLQHKSSSFLKWNIKSPPLTYCINSIIDNDIKNNPEAEAFLNYPISSNRSKTISRKLNNESVSLRNTVRPCVDDENLTKCYENLKTHFVKNYHEKHCDNDELDQDSRQIYTQKLLLWSKNLEYDLADVEKWLKMENCHVIDTGRMCVYKKYWLALRRYLKMQKKLLESSDLIFTSSIISDKNSLLINGQVERTCVISNADRSIKTDNNNYDELLLVPRAMIKDQKIAASLDIKDHVLSYFSNRLFFCLHDYLLKIKQYIFHLTKHERKQLEWQLHLAAKNQQNPMNFYELEEILKKLTNSQMNAHRHKFRLSTDSNMSGTRARTSKNSNATDYNTCSVSTNFNGQHYHRNISKTNCHNSHDAQSELDTENLISSVNNKSKSAYENKLLADNYCYSSEYFNDNQQYNNYHDRLSTTLMQDHTNISINTAENCTEYFQFMTTCTARLHLKHYLSLMLQ